MAGVAFSGKFWSMQHDCAGAIWSFLRSGCLPFQSNSGENQKLKRQEAKKKKEETP
jgi:hypothetical protein